MKKAINNSSLYCIKTFVVLLIIMGMTLGSNVNASKPDTPEIAIAPPTAYSATNVTSSSFTASWSSVATSNGYLLYVYKQFGTTWSVLSSYNGLSISGTSTNVSGLTSKTNYKYSVKSRARTGDSDFSNEIPVTTDSEIPDAPHANDATSITKNSFTASWNAVSGATSYIFRVIDMTSMTLAVNTEITELSYNVTGLNPDNPYLYIVRAKNSAGTSDESNPVSLNTKPTAPLAQPAESITTTSFNAQWNAVDRAASYKLSVYESQFGFIVSGFNGKTVGNVTMFNVTGLSPGTGYYYKVQTVGTNGGISLMSDAIELITLPAKPTATEPSELTSTSFIANWTSVTGATSYKFYMEEGIRIIYDGTIETGNSKNITGLLPDHLYSYRVKAVNSSGTSEESNTINVRTETATITTYYTLTLSTNPGIGGTTGGEGIFEGGENVTVHAYPSTGYEFVNWTEGETIWSPYPSYSFYMNTNRTLVANFRLLTYYIYTMVTPMAGGRTSGDVELEYGEIHTIEAYPNAGYDFVNWTENGTAVSTSASYTFTVTGERNLVANFVQQTVPTYTINSSAAPVAGGNTNINGVQYESGESITLIAIANTGYDFVNWTENGTEVSTLASYTFTVSVNRNLVANFSTQSFIISSEALPTIGGTTNITSESYAYNENVTLIATPAEGYDFVNWTENGVVTTTSTYIFNVTANRHLVANFKIKTFTITSNPSPSEGGETSISNENYDWGETVTITATPNNGYSFVNWTENNVIVSVESDYTFTVTADRNLLANFSNQSFTISTEALPTIGGSTNISSENYYYGEQVMILAIPAEGYNFLNWTENGIIKATTAEYSFIVSENQHLVANFEIQKFVVNAISNNNGAGQVSFTTQNFNYGELATIIATPRERCKFINWTEDGNEVSTEPQFSFTVTKNYNLTANFALETGIWQTENEQFKLWPNPANDFIQLSGIEKSSNLKIYSLSGEKIYKTKNSELTEFIDISSLKNGIYFLQIESKSEQSILKFIKQ